MKKIFLGVTMLIIAISASAQGYKASIGINTGSFNGFSYKGFLTDHLVLQVDLGVNIEGTYGQEDWYADAGVIGGTHGFQSFYTCEANPNLMYQAEISSFDAGTLSWFAGGGLSAGIMNNLNPKYSRPIFKWGLNGIGGIELHFSKVPVALSFDLRPGYGMSTHRIKPTNTTAVGSFFDWKAAIGVRYVF